MQRMWIALIVAVSGLVLSSFAAEKDTPAAANMRNKKLKAIISIDVKDQQLQEIFKDISEQTESQGLGPISVKYATGVSRNQRLTFKADKMTVEQVLDGLLGTNKLGYIVVSTTDVAQKRYDGWLEIRTGNERGTPMEEDKSGKAVAKTPAKVDPKALVKADPKAAPKEEMKKEEMTKEEPKTVVKNEPKEEPKEEPKDEPKKEARSLDEIKKEKLEAAATTYYDLAMTYLDSGKNDKAKAKLQEIIRLFPTTDVANEAKKQLEDLK